MHRDATDPVAGHGVTRVTFFVTDLEKKHGEGESADQIANCIFSAMAVTDGIIQLLRKSVH
jgi:hypothetical protein